MSVFKKFFEKRKLNAKFKLAGEGQRMDMPSSSHGASSSKSQPRVAERQVPTAAGSKAADAALARLQQGQQMQQKKPMSKTATWKSKEESQSGGTAIDYQAMAKQMQSSVKQNSKPRSQRSMSSTSASSTSSAENAPPVPPVLDTAPHICPACPMSIPKCQFLDHLQECLLNDLASEPLLISVSMILSLNKDEEKVQVCVQTLCKYLQNIVDHADEEKYRKIRQGNKVFQEKVAALKGTEEFLTLACGFELQTIKNDQGEDQMFYVLNPEGKDFVEHLTVAKTMLVEAEPLKPTLDRNLKVYEPCANANRIQVPDEFYELSSSEIRQEQLDRSTQVEKEKQLRTKAMRESEKDKKKRVYRYTVIRVRLPDDVLIQGTFRGRETLNDVTDFVRENLQLDWLPFRLTSPIGESYNDLKITLHSANLAPAALLLCTIDADISAELSASFSNEGRNVQFLKDEVQALMESLG